MAGTVSIRGAERGDDSVLAQVETLLVEMYEHMSRHGLMLPLAEDGAQGWRRGVEAKLGRLGALIVAESDGQVVGFAEGTIRLLPNYLSGEKVGHIGHVYVAPRLRGNGIGERLYLALETWFLSQGVSNLELQVLCGNKRAIEFWSAAGFTPELLQMRRQVPTQR